jgi:hypothetical protein
MYQPSITKQIGRLNIIVVGLRVADAKGIIAIRKILKNLNLNFIANHPKTISEKLNAARRNVLEVLASAFEPNRGVKAIKAIAIILLNVATFEKSFPVDIRLKRIMPSTGSIKFNAFNPKVLINGDCKEYKPPTENIRRSLSGCIVSL